MGWLLRLDRTPRLILLSVFLGVVGGYVVDVKIAELAVEEAVVRAAAELAIGCEFQADALLEADGILDGGVLDLGQFVAAELAACKFGSRIKQHLWTQQAADVLGPERGLMPLRGPLLAFRQFHSLPAHANSLSHTVFSANERAS